MRIAAAGGFEAAVGAGQALIKRTAARSAEGFVGAPAAGGKALGGVDHVERVGSGLQMFLTALGEPGLHGGTESIAIAVSMMGGQDVIVFGERIEISAIEQIAGRHF